jgi:hypothetical protein
MPRGATGASYNSRLFLGTRAFLAPVRGSAAGGQIGARLRRHRAMPDGAMRPIIEWRACRCEPAATAAVKAHWPTRTDSD